MRVIVIGAGEVGQNIARTLSAQRHEVTVVDEDARRVEAMQGEVDAMVLIGNGASPKFLREVGVAKADMVCAVTQSDEANVIAALTSRQLGARYTAARVRDPDYFDPGEAVSREMLGIDFVINPDRAAAEDLAEAILLPGAIHVEHFADGRVTVAETVLTERSPLLGSTIGERRMVRPHSIVGLIWEGRTIRAEAWNRPKRGDHLIVAAAREDIRATVAHLAGYASKVNDVVIFGAGRVGLALARLLEEAAQFRITLMEQDADRARFVAERLRDATVLHEEGVSEEAMVAHGVDRVGAFVACAGDDRTNLLAALHAKKLGAGLCLSVVSRAEFVPLVDALGIDAAVSPRLVAAEAILRAVRGENVHAMHLLLGGGEVLEVRADPGCRVEGRTLKDITSMAKAEVAALIRAGAVVTPRGDDHVQAGDRLVLFSPRQGLIDVSGNFRSR